MRSTSLAGLAIVGLVCCSTLSVAAQQKPTVAVNAEAVTLVDFKSRIDAYVSLREKVAKDMPPLKETDNAGSIKARQDALGKAIAAARSTAKPGDVFTPDIAAKVRKLLAPELKGEDGRDAKAVVKDDAPTGIPFKVNAAYPEGASLPTVPSNLLLNLPTLPKVVEYRIIEKHLILRDTEANIIVDYIPNVMR